MTQAWRVDEMLNGADAAGGRRLSTWNQKVVSLDNLALLGADCMTDTSDGGEESAKARRVYVRDTSTVASTASHGLPMAGPTTSKWESREKKRRGRGRLRASGRGLLQENQVDGVKMQDSKRYGGVRGFGHVTPPRLAAWRRGDQRGF